LRLALGETLSREEEKAELVHLHETYRRAIDNANREAEDRNASGDLPLAESRKSIFDDADDYVAESDISAYAEHEEHQKEEHGEELRYYREFRQGFRIGDESQAGSAANNAAYVIAADLVSQIAQNTEDGGARY